MSENLHEPPVPGAEPPSGLVDPGGAPRAPVTRSRDFVRLLLLLDVVTVYICFVAFAWLRLGSGVRRLDFLTSPLLPAAVTLLVMFVIRGYSHRRDMQRANYVAEHVFAFLVATLLTFLLVFVGRMGENLLFSTRLTVIASFAAVAGISLLYRQKLQSRFNDALRSRSLILIGSEGGIRELRDRLVENGELRRIVLVPAGADPDDASALDTSLIERLVEADDVGCDGIIVADGVPARDAHLWDLLARLHSRAVPLYSVPVYFERVLHRVWLANVDYRWFLSGHFELQRSDNRLRIKRAMDVASAVLGLLFFSPVCLLLYWAIPLGSNGPAILQQTRIGLNGKAFTLYKFRTMTMGSEDSGLYTLPDDPRVIGIGNVLRKFRLDELPQLWNVLIGDMSLIGPRAELEALVRVYEREIKFYHLRHLVKPGITGLAQVYFPYGGSVEDTLRKLEYDLYYVRNYSLSLDLEIFLRTVHVMLSHGGR